MTRLGTQSDHTISSVLTRARISVSITNLQSTIDRVSYFHRSIAKTFNSTAVARENDDNENDNNETTIVAAQTMTTTMIVVSSYRLAHWFTTVSSCHNKTENGPTERQLHRTLAEEDA